MSQSQPPAAVSYDPITPALLISDLRISELSVLAESQRWSTGRRGDTVEPAALAGADLSAFVSQAMTIGSHAISAAGGAQDKFDLERLVHEVGARTSESSTKAGEATSAAAASAAEVFSKASATALRSISDADAATRKSFAETVASANRSLQGELQRIFGGESPELVEKLRPVLATFSRELDARVSKQTGDLLEKAARQFDPADPTSPMAKHAVELRQQQDALSLTLGQHHESITSKVDELASAVKVSFAAREAAARTAKITPLKGTTYAEGVHAVLHELATGLGDEYSDTSSMTGALARCKKGDGVLSIDGGTANVVVEMTDSARASWNDYLDEAERNRDAAASLGLVRSPAQNGGQSIRVLGSRRIVLAFDPASDGPELLRAVVQLLRVVAIAAGSRRDAEGLATAEERIAEAQRALEKVNLIRKASGSIRKGADTIDGECNSVQTTIDRVLGQALDALSGVTVDAVEAVVQRLGDSPPRVPNNRTEVGAENDLGRVSGSW